MRAIAAASIWPLLVIASGAAAAASRKRSTDA